MSLVAGFRSHYQSLGVRGVLAATGRRLIGHPKTITVRPKSVRHPVTLRLHTTDLGAYEGVLLAREYEVERHEPPKVILDAGANIGMASLYFANRHPEARIVAVEAESSNYRILAHNVRHYPQITPIHAALWKTDGWINVSAPDPASGAHGEWGFVTTRNAGGGPQVRSLTVQTLMRETGVQAFDLAKIDIEGAEIEVFEDSSWLSGVRCLMIELHDRFRPGCGAKVEPAMSGFARTQRGETVFYRR
jgi:FkbM family methyltransferase